jgi:hypothetical protein
MFRPVFNKMLGLVKFNISICNWVDTVHEKKASTGLLFRFPTTETGVS